MVAPGQIAQATHRTVKHRESVGVCPPSHISCQHHTPIILLALCLFLVTGLKSWFSPTWVTFDK